jgi:hypothetical protein
MSKSTKYLLVGFVAFLGISVLATTSLPFTFQAGQPIKADEVNANFQTLADGLNILEGTVTTKQAAITTTPCGAGQFVQGVGVDGTLACAIDQIGSAGSSGVSSLNGKTGSLAIEGGDGVTVETSDDGKVTISAGVSAGGTLEAQAVIALPSSGTINSPNPAFSITNNGGIALSGSSPTGIGVYAFSGNTGYGVSAYSEKNYGVLSTTNTGLAGVYGVGKASGGTGVRGTNNGGPGSSGVWGDSALGSGVRGGTTSGTGVLGNSNTGYGVRGLVSQAGTGVYGENSSTTTAGAGVQGRANYVNSVGVNGLSNNGIGVSGSSNTNKGVVGTILSTSAGVNSVAVEGVNNSAAGYGVRGKGAVGVYGETVNPDGSGVEGVTKSTSNSAGVYGHSDTTGVGVWGRNRSQGGVAMRADGNAKQELGFGGFAKAMVIVDTARPAGQQIVRCYNSQASGAAMNTTPCGFSLQSATGQWRVIFGFDVTKTFAAATLLDRGDLCIDSLCIPFLSGVTYESDSVVVKTRGTDNKNNYREPDGFTLILY